MKACFQIAECSLSYAKIVKKIMPRKFYAFFLPRSPLFYAMIPFLRIER